MIFANKPIGTIGYLGGLPAVLEPFCWAWGQLIQYNTEYLVQPGQFVHYVRATMSFHSFARNNLVDTMLGDWLLMLDTDHAPEPDLAVRMLSLMNQTGVEVLTALYLHKTPPFSPVLYQNGIAGGFKPIGDWDQDVSAFAVGSAGAGALLVKRTVFERIRKELKEGPFDIEFPYGEDHSFFRRLDKLKIQAFAAPRIESPHLMVKSVTLEDYRYKQRELQFEDRTEVPGFS
jgi:hypothetical protein